jgi:hypothetical protein
MRKLSLQRRKVVVLAASTAAMSGVGPLLFQKHPYLRIAWVGFMAVMLVVVVLQLAKLKKAEGVSRFVQL